MRKGWIYCLGLIAAVALGASVAGSGTPYTFHAQLVETCNCELFCSCFTSGKPTHHHCDAQVGFVVKKGNVGDVRLDGMKVHYAGVLGKETYFTFEPSATAEQVEAFKKIARAVYGDYWPAPADIVRAPIDIRIEAERATVKTQDAEIVLKKFQGQDGAQPAVVQNVKYFSARNKGFVLFPAEKHLYTGHGKQFNYSNNNGFLIEIEASGTI